MGTIETRRDAAEMGSIICDNGFARLRVLRLRQTLGLAFDTRVDDHQWATLLHAPLLPDDDTPGAPAYEYYSCIPLQICGSTRGVTLHGSFEGSAITLTVCLNEESTWCHVCFETEASDQQLSHHWWLLTPPGMPDVSWPPPANAQQHLAGNPTAFFQRETLFAALVPDLAEGECGVFDLRFCDDRYPGFTYNFHATDASSHLAYNLCLDAHALPAYGYQQIVRFLGDHKTLGLAAIPPQANTRPQTLPTLPAVPDSAGWQPCKTEGSPAEIAALVRHALAQTRPDEWQMLENGLYWLDRLCLHQHLLEIPGAVTFGSFGDGESWVVAAPWMPQLLLTAFQLTGIPEYAYRAIAAIGALSPALQSTVLAHLYPQFGDIYIDLESGEAVLFTEFDYFHSEIIPNGIALNVACTGRISPIQLVVNGTQESYTIIVNGECLGALPTDILRAGIELPTSATAVSGRAPSPFRLHYSLAHLL